MIRRTLASALVALAVLAVPTVAGAGTDQYGNTVGTDASAGIECWYAQSPTWAPPASTVPELQTWRATRVRQRSDGRWEVAVGTDHGSAPGCVEIIAGSGIWVAPEDAGAVAGYLKARALEAAGSVEIRGEVVPASLALGWFIVSGRAACESGEQWHAHPDGFFQIIRSTWVTNGGLEFGATAGAASAPDQVTMFLRVLDAQGERAWSCR